MKNKTLKAATAATLLAAALAFAAPTAAYATYNEGDEAAVSDSTVAPGGVVELAVEEDVFAGNVPVTITLTGESASGASLAFVKFAVETANLGTVTSAADGSLNAEVRLPSNAIGQYTIAATGVDPAGNIVTADVSFTAVAAGGGAGSGSGSGDALAPTGGDTSALLGFWIGGGALLLAGGGLAVAGTVRRHRQQVAA